MTILVFLMAMTGLFLCSFVWYRKGVQVGRREKEDFMSDRHIETMNQVFANIDAVSYTHLRAHET